MFLVTWIFRGSEESLKRCDRINSAVSLTGSSSGHLIALDQSEAKMVQFGV